MDCRNYDELLWYQKCIRVINSIFRQIHSDTKHVKVLGRIVTREKRWGWSGGGDGGGDDE